MSNRVLCLIPMILTVLMSIASVAVDAQIMLPEEFSWSKWNDQGDKIALSSPDGKLWIFTDELRFVQMLDMRLPGATEFLPPSRLSELEWSPDGKRLAAMINFEGIVPGIAGLAKYLLLWDTATWEQLAVIHSMFGPWHLAWNPDSTEFAVKWGYFKLQVFDADGAPLRTIADDEAVYYFDWHPVNVNEMALATSQGVELWDPITSEKVITLTEHISMEVEYDPLSSLLALDTGEFNIEVWDTEARQQVIVTGPDKLFAFSWSCGELFTLGYDREWYRWDIETGASSIVALSANPRSWTPDCEFYLNRAIDSLEMVEAATGDVKAMLALSTEATPISTSLPESEQP